MIMILCLCLLRTFTEDTVQWQERSITEVAVCWVSPSPRLSLVWPASSYSAFLLQTSPLYTRLDRASGLVSL